MEITLNQAYRMARKFYRRKWTGRAQYHLSAIGEREDVWVISFFPFIPDPLYTKFLTYQKCELCHVRGIIPVYYDSNPKWIEVRKDTGDCREVLYKGYDWLFGPGKEHEREIRQETIRKEQKRSFWISVAVFLVFLLITLSVERLRPVLRAAFSGIARVII